MSKTQKTTGQYLKSIRRSLQRIDGRSFNHYPVKLKDHRLLKFLLSKAYIEKRYMPDMIEELIVKGLAKDKSYQDYVENDLTVEIQTKPTLRFFNKSCLATQAERRKGHSENTAS